MKKNDQTPHRLAADVMLQRFKWPAGVFEREGSMGQVMVWLLLPLGALLSLGSCSLTLIVPFPRSVACTLTPSFLGGLTTILFLETIQVRTVPKG